MVDALIVFTANYLYIVPVLLFIGYSFFTSRRREFLITAFFLLPLSYLTAKILSHFYYDPRPFVVSHVIPLFHHAPDNGFPSDHALLTGTLAAGVMPFSAWLAALLWVLAFLVGGARVVAHVHHTIDIVGSFVIALVSLGIVRLGMYLVRARRARKESEKEVEDTAALPPSEE